MDGEFVRLDDVVEVTDEYHNFMEKFKNRIEQRDIPSWILIPKRSSGEHASGYAWLGIVMSVCGSEDSDGVIDTRVAIDTSGRDRVQSDVGDIPDAFLKYINKGYASLDRDVKTCVARITYDTTTQELDDIDILFFLEEEIEEVEEES